ncbi:MAG: hypothetical protein KKG75_01380 [Nanoarchaeota archaeon]|nr:hypothetical protein [Nanoarchaeota archaeon]
MKKIKPFREAKKKIIKNYIIILIESKNSLYIPIPEEIAKSFGIKQNDLAIFEKVNQDDILIRFVKNNLYSFIKKLGGNKNENRRSIKQTKKGKKQIS